MKSAALTLLASLLLAGCVVVPAEPVYGPARVYPPPPPVLVAPPRPYLNPPPVVIVPARPYGGPGYWSPRPYRY